MSNPEIKTDANNQSATAPPMIRPRPDQDLELAPRPEIGEQILPGVDTTHPHATSVRDSFSTSMNSVDLSRKADELRDSMSSGALGKIQKRVGEAATKLFLGSTTDRILAERRNMARKKHSGDTLKLELLLAAEAREAEKEQ